MASSFVAVVADTKDLAESFNPSMEDRNSVAQMLGRPPTLPFRVARRACDGEILVIEIYPVRDGYPDGNWFWLTSRRWVRAVSRVEALGGVRSAESEVSPEALALAHRTYAIGRNALCPSVTSVGGVGGARTGVKCLHSHLAFLLAGGFSPVGSWALQRVFEMQPRLLDDLG
ncbi:MAG: DUF501 domain-containing protein [Ferrimicrobium sp.]